MMGNCLRRGSNKTVCPDSTTSCSKDNTTRKESGIIRDGDYTSDDVENFDEMQTTAKSVAPHPSPTQTGKFPVAIFPVSPIMAWPSPIDRVKNVSEYNCESETTLTWQTGESTTSLRPNAVHVAGSAFALTGSRRSSTASAIEPKSVNRLQAVSRQQSVTPGGIVPVISNSPRHSITGETVVGSRSTVNLTNQPILANPQVLDCKNDSPIEPREPESERSGAKPPDVTLDSQISNSALTASSSFVRLVGADEKGLSFEDSKPFTADDIMRGLGWETREYNQFTPYPDYAPPELDNTASTISRTQRTRSMDVERIGVMSLPNSSLFTPPATTPIGSIEALPKTVRVETTKTPQKSYEELSKSSEDPNSNVLTPATNATTTNDQLPLYTAEVIIGEVMNKYAPNDEVLSMEEFTASAAFGVQISLDYPVAPKPTEQTTATALPATPPSTGSAQKSPVVTKPADTSYRSSPKPPRKKSPAASTLPDPSIPAPTPTDTQTHPQRRHSVGNGSAAGNESSTDSNLRNELLREMPRFEVAIKQYMVPEVYHAGQYIIKKHEIGKEMYFIVTGKVEVVSGDGSTVYSTIHKGSFFGE
ncbi:hypothetical protein BJ742DRAFT_51606 [Cladochytrium replicatum]|nr:hypothetical protein BJ742DRAFT_51606 [Cladochytrium replicatum]